MIDSHSKIMALLTAASLLVITAVVILAYQLGLFGRTTKIVPDIRQNHSEIMVINSK